MPETVGEVFVAIRPDLSGLEAEIDAGISSIIADIKVGADTTQLVADVEAATTEATSAAPAIDVTANVDEATAAVEQLTLFTDAQAPTVAVTADTGPAQDEIDALVSTASGEAIDIPVTSSGAADTTNSLEGVQTAAENLHGASEITAGSAAGLTTILSRMGPGGAAAATGIAALTAGTTELFSAGLDAVSAEERFNRLLGDQADVIKNIDVGTLQTNIFDLGQEFGSTTAQVQNSASTMFQFAQNAGASRDESSKFVDQISALSARAISLNPQLGSLSDVTDTLSTRIARGGRFAASFGISLTPAEINARALGDTGKNTASELTLFEKAAAGAEIATEKYGASLGQTVTEGSKNAQVEVRALSAEFKNAIEEIGKPLVAPVIEVLHDAIEPGKEVGAIFADLGQIALPLLDTGLRIAAGPLAVIGATLEIIAPPLQTVADLIDRIPGPVLAAAGTFVSFVFVINSLPAIGLAVSGALLGVVDAVTAVAVGTAGALTTLTLTLATVQPELLLVGAAVAGVTFLMQDGAASTQGYDAALSSLGSSLDGLKGGADPVNDSFKTFLDTLAKTNAELPATRDHSVSFNDAFREAGVTTQQFLDHLSQGGAAFATWIEGLRTSGKISDDTSAALIHLGGSFDEQGKNALDAAVHTGTLTQAQVDHEVATRGGADTLGAYSGALTALQPIITDATAKTDAAAASDQKAAQAKQDAIDKANAQRKALADLGTTAPGVALALAGINTTLGSQVPGLETLAINIGKAKLSNDQIAAIASGFGVSADQLATFVKNVNDAIDGLNKDAESKIPAVTDGLDRIVKFAQGIPDAFDPKVLIKSFQDQIQATQDFENNLAVLHGAGLDNLVTLAEKEGPQATAALVKGIQQGGPELGRQLNDTYKSAADQAAVQVPNFLQGLNAAVVVNTGQVGQLATDAFGNTFRIEAPTEKQLQIAYQKAALFGIPFAQALADTAGGGAVAYEQGIGAIPPATQVSINGALTTINAAQPGAQTAGAGLGGATNVGFGAGITGLSEHGTDIGTNVYESLTDPAVTRNINEATNVLTIEIVGGLIHGLDSADSHKALADAMTRLINSGIGAANTALKPGSPSKVFTAFGKSIGDGLVVGMDNTMLQVAAAAHRLASTAIAPDFNAPVGFNDTTSTNTSPANVAGALTRQGDTINIYSTDPFIAAAEVLRIKRSRAKALQR